VRETAAGPPGSSFLASSHMSSPTPSRQAAHKYFDHTICTCATHKSTAAHEYLGHMACTHTHTHTAHRPRTTPRRSLASLGTGRSIASAQRRPAGSLHTPLSTFQLGHEASDHTRARVPHRGSGLTRVDSLHQRHGLLAAGCFHPGLDRVGDQVHREAAAQPSLAVEDDVALLDAEV